MSAVRDVGYQVRPQRGLTPLKDGLKLLGDVLYLIQRLVSDTFLMFQLVKSPGLGVILTVDDIFFWVKATNLWISWGFGIKCTKCGSDGECGHNPQTGNAAEQTEDSTRVP